MAPDADMSWHPPFTGKRVLISGGFGFLGSHLARHLIAARAEVTVLDIDTMAQRRAQINLTPGLRRQLTVCSGDVMDRVLLADLFGAAQFDYVFNFAAFSSVIERAAMHPTETLAVNSLGGVHLLEAARQAGQHLQCFLHASTDKVYGDHAGEPYVEGAQLRGRGLYESSKIAAETFALSYSRAYELPVTVVRLCNVFGPFDIDGIGYRIVPRSMAAMFGVPPAAPEVYRDSRHHRRDYIFVDDCCRAIMMLAASGIVRSPNDDPTFNLAGCENLTTSAMCEATIAAAAAVADRAGERAEADRIRADGYRLEGCHDASVPTIAEQRMNGDRLRQATGFRPETTLRDGLEQTAAFYREFLR